MSKGRALVTGGAGFIGSHTAEELLRAGYDVRVLDNLTPPIHTGDGEWPDWLPKDVARRRCGVSSCRLSGLASKLLAILPRQLRRDGVVVRIDRRREIAGEESCRGQQSIRLRRRPLSMREGRRSLPGRTQPAERPMG